MAVQNKGTCSRHRNGYVPGTQRYRKPGCPSCDEEAAQGICHPTAPKRVKLTTWYGKRRAGVAAAAARKLK